MTRRAMDLHRVTAAGAALERLAETVEARLAALDRTREGTAAVEMAEVLRAVAALASESRMEALLERMLDGIIKLTLAERAFVVLKEGPEALRFAAARARDGRTVDAPDDRISRSLVYEVLATGRSLVVADAMADESYRGLHSVAHHRIRSLACVAIETAGVRSGAFYLDGGERPGAITEEELPLIEAFARLSGAAIANLERRSRHKKEREELARELESQRTMALARLREARRARIAAGEEEMAGTSPAMQRVNDLVDRAAAADLPVLVLGESGVGKELVARALHERSPRRAGPFVAQNCAALPESLIESELFGSVKGAFTGADQDRPGLFVLAHGGTLLLDEVGEIPLPVQTKLLRALQEGEVRPLGSERPVAFRTRIVAATNRDLGALVEEGRFREDLYFRLKVIEIRIPPLRERPEDVPRLVEHFLRASKKPRRFAPEAMKLLLAYHWPGNVRQLKHEVERALVLAEGEEIGPGALSKEVRGADAGPYPFRDAGGAPLPLRDLEAVAIRAALAHTSQDRSAAARLLGISRSTLYEKLKTIDLEG